MSPANASAVVQALASQRGVHISTSFAAQHAPQGGGGLDQAVQAVYRTWLHTDIQETVDTHALPSAIQLPALPETGKSSISQDFSLQVDSILDVGESAYSQLTECRKRAGIASRGADTALPEEDEDADGDAAAALTQQQQQHSQRGRGRTSKQLLKIKLTNGVTSIVGMELKPLPFLNRESTPGIKVRVKRGTRAIRGLLLLSPSCCELLGGGVPCLTTEKGHAAILHKCFGLDANSTDATTAGEGTAQAQPSPPRQQSRAAPSSRQSRRTSATRSRSSPRSKTKAAVRTTTTTSTAVAASKRPKGSPSSRRTLSLKRGSDKQTRIAPPSRSTANRHAASAQVVTIDDDDDNGGDGGDDNDDDDGADVAHYNDNGRAARGGGSHVGGQKIEEDEEDSAFEQALLGGVEALEKQHEQKRRQDPPNVAPPQQRRQRAQQQPHAKGSSSLSARRKAEPTTTSTPTSEQQGSSSISGGDGGRGMEAAPQWSKGKVTAFGDGLKIKQGQWNLVLTIQPQSGTPFVAPVATEFLDRFIGMNVSEFKAQRRAAKRDPSLRSTLLDRLSRVERAMMSKTSQFRVVVRADGTQTVVDHVP